MAIVINGSGTVTGITAGGLPDGSITNDDLATGIDAGKLTGTLPAIDGSALTNLPAGGGTPDVQLNYNGNTQTVRTSSGVSSVTYNSQGKNTVNFSSSFANTNYYIAGNYSNGSGFGDFQGLDAYNHATNYLEVYTCYVSATNSGSSPHNVLNFYLNIWSA